jgi:hypothetical protein
MVFAYAGTPAFFSIISEMRNPRNYTKSMVVCQSTVTAVYTAIGIVVYYYCGSYVASPALGSAGDLMKRVCYGLALPGLLVSTLILLHVLFPPLKRNLSAADKYTATSKVLFRSLAEGFKASGGEHPCALDRLVLLYGHKHRSRIHYRQCHTGFRRPRLTRWRLIWNSHVFSAIWVHVAF